MVIISTVWGGGYIVYVNQRHRAEQTFGIATFGCVTVTFVFHDGHHGPR